MASPRWRLEDDALSCAGLRLVWQRISLTPSRAEGTLRSAGLAPLHRVADMLCVPCGQDEVLWLGACVEAPGTTGEVWLQQADGTLHTFIEAVSQTLPIISAAGGQQAIRRPSSQPRWTLRLGVVPQVGDPVEIELMLMSPTAWCLVSDRPWQALDGPAPT